jgi:hypothetical protein
MPFRGIFSFDCVVRHRFIPRGYGSGMYFCILIYTPCTSYSLCCSYAPCPGNRMRKATSLGLPRPNTISAKYRPGNRLFSTFSSEMTPQSRCASIWCVPTAVARPRSTPKRPFSPAISARSASSLTRRKAGHSEKKYSFFSTGSKKGRFCGYAGR